MKYNIKDLAAKAKIIKSTKNVGAKRLMTEDELNAVRELRQRGYSITTIYETLKNNNLTKYKSELGFRTAYKNR